MALFTKIWTVFALLCSVHMAFATPTEKVPHSEWPIFMDDLNFTLMETVIDRQLTRYQQRSMRGTIKFGKDVFRRTAIVQSLKLFKKMTTSYKACLAGGESQSVCWQSFNTKLKNQFDLYRPLLKPGDPRYGEAKQTLFTAYFTPAYEGSYTQTAKFRYPIYAVPTDPQLRSKTREEIDFDYALEGEGYELFYVENLFDLYILHVQGGGKVIVKTPSGVQSHYLSYAGTNGQTWRFISKYMQSKGYIDNLGVAAQRKFLQENPHLEREIYSYCPSYVYFKETLHPPEGSDLVALTDGRSIATDYNRYSFKGALAYIVARKPAPTTKMLLDPQLQMVDFSRFALDQDTGGAIKGKARVDIYFGEGPYAELAASNVVEKGDLYFLMAKGLAHKK